MKIEKEDFEKLSKIGIHTILDLALFLPHSLEDTTLSKEPKNGNVCVEIEIKSTNFTHKKMLLSNAWCKQWDMLIKIVIFNAKSWHVGLFKVGKEFTVFGPSSLLNGVWQIVNPKIISKSNTTILKYKSEIKNDTLLALVSKYITYENLSKEGLSQDEIKVLLDLHSPKQYENTYHELTKENTHANKLIKFIEIYNYLKKLSAKKTNFKSKKIAIFDIKEWLLNLPFTPTQDQLRAIEDIRADLLSPVSKRRVVMGDVGSGKTLVMLATSLSIYPNTAILMAPTGILACQLYNEALRLLPSYMKVELFLGGNKKEDISFDGVNLIIGTHALLYLKLPKSPLVMIDEQHRFGSRQRELISILASEDSEKPHFVQFSATPIPRTLGLIQSTLVDFSFLKQIPFKKNIMSKVIKSSDFEGLLNHIKDQVSKNKQTIIVYPLISESDKSNYQSLQEAQSFWLSNFKNVFITHGKDREKESVLEEFKEHGNILLSTTVIEVGISLPRLSTIVVVGAERLGLATLHQLRGRVGRNGGDGWCFLFTKLKNIPKRLLDFCDTLDGFKVAEIDLKNRQSGDILNGNFQHGATFKFYDYEDDITKAAKDRLAMSNNFKTY